MTTKKMSRREEKKAKLKALFHDKHNQIRGTKPLSDARMAGFVSRNS